MHLARDRVLCCIHIYLIQSQRNEHINCIVKSGFAACVRASALIAKQNKNGIRKSFSAAKKARLTNKGCYHENMLEAIVEPIRSITLKMAFVAICTDAQVERE